MSYEAIAEEINKNQGKFIARLREAVAIPSVSAEPERRQDVFEMINWTEKLMTKLGVKCQQFENGQETLPDGSSIKLPPVLYGFLGEDPKKKTLLVYGHLDVQPAHKDDGWDTEPFELVEKDGKLFGRGSTDDKGPVLGWLNAIEVMQGLGVEVPINIKFVFEGMEESGSVGLEDILLKHKDPILVGVDFVCISDNYWLGKSKPCITYGLRGCCCYSVEISGPKQDLHSGSFGGTICEPMNDLCWLLGQLVDARGTILIPGINELVAELTEKERRLYESIDFNLGEYRNDIGVEMLTSDCPKEILMRRWRFPTLSVHGVEGAFHGPGSKTVIPCKVIGKFSLRIVPNMDPSDVDKFVVSHLNELWKKRGSPNKINVVARDSNRSWVADFTDDHYKAGIRAIRRVFGVEPDFTREGGSIPIALTFEEMTGKSVMLLPMGAGDDMAHSQNEKINVVNYIGGTKTLASYLLECGTL